MTRSLLVNCYLDGRVLKELSEAVGKFNEYTVVKYSDISKNYQIDDEIGAVILSGSEARIVNPLHRNRFAEVLQLIKTCDLPILGICFGHQLLCWAFGAQEDSLDKGVFNRFEEVKVVQVDGIFAGFQEKKTIPLSESHHDYVLKKGLDAAGFTLLANSVSCQVEAVKHKIKPFYGVQFHPERITHGNESHPEGHRIIENFYRKIVKR